ncbi:SEC-C metal-binding domain-containing protein [Myxococcus sp. MISCRS1]|uniref:YecA family protein n=1 Tax=Myxococcus sp. MISCRS1 TaxID=2996786 RepID=UPI002271739C|nr:SEC-C metal-binding domain-containing protein [Myxococcus sp. MISCRS1]MCY1001818.1 SEC-C metal-binding domain-containing protein [Myxococcus sp. MISCRS1]BDT36612.1 SEC-C metal-binding domain-containing protein [Myxococcus sp. MH1]
MSQKKPGRNDPCPCGSGKKYKVCHASEDRARAAPPVAPTSGQTAVRKELENPDVSYLAVALDRFGKLLAEWGPGPGLRFDAEAFDKHVGQELARISEVETLDANQAHRELLVGTVKALATKSFLDRLAAVLRARSEEPGLPAEDQRALRACAVIAGASKASSRLRPENNPILDVVFDVQFREWSTRHKEWLAKYELLASGMSEGSLSEEARKALQQARDGDVDALVDYVKEDPGLAERIAREAKERAARVEAKLREPSTPPVFAPEEELWLTCVLWEPMQALKGLPQGAEPAQRREAVTALLRGVKGALDEDFLVGMLNRMRQKSQDAAVDEALRAFYADAAIAFEAEPARMSLAALLTARQEAQGRSAEEMVALADLKALTTWTPESFEPYRQLLLRMNLPASAERIQRCQEWLKTHPVALRAATPE